MTSAVRLTADERTQLMAGEPVTRLLDADESKEVAVFGAVWIDGRERATGVNPAGVLAARPDHPSNEVLTGSRAVRWRSRRPFALIR